MLRNRSILLFFLAFSLTAQGLASKQDDMFHDTTWDHPALVHHDMPDQQRVISRSRWFSSGFIYGTEASIVISYDCDTQEWDQFIETTILEPVYKEKIGDHYFYPVMVEMDKKTSLTLEGASAVGGATIFFSPASGDAFRSLLQDGESIQMVVDYRDEGTVTWAWNISNVNRLFAAMPSLCPQA